MSTQEKEQWDALFAFREAAMRDDLEGMRRVLAKDSSFIKRENPDDLPLDYLAKTYQIHTCAREGPIERVRKLAEEFRHLVRQHWHAQRWLPLTQAACGNQLDTFKLLMEYGASADDRIGVGGGTALQFAVVYERLEMVRLALEAGANPNALAPDGSSPASSAKSDEMRSLIVRYVSHG